MNNLIKNYLYMYVWLKTLGSHVLLHISSCGTTWKRKYAMHVLAELLQSQGVSLSF